MEDLLGLRMWSRIRSALANGIRHERAARCMPGTSYLFTRAFLLSLNSPIHAWGRWRKVWETERESERAGKNPFVELDQDAIEFLSSKWEDDRKVEYLGTSRMTWLRPAHLHRFPISRSGGSLRNIWVSTAKTTIFTMLVHNAWIKKTVSLAASNILGSGETPHFCFSFIWRAFSHFQVQFSI